MSQQNSTHGRLTVFRLTENGRSVIDILDAYGYRGRFATLRVNWAVVSDLKDKAVLPALLIIKHDTAVERR